MTVLKGFHWMLLHKDYFEEYQNVTIKKKTKLKMKVKKLSSNNVQKDFDMQVLSSLNS